MAGALNKRDIEMIFRADTDKATRPIADLGKAVKTTTGQVRDLVEAAGRGEISLDKLGTATKDLKQAQDELGTARGLLTQLNAQEASLEKAADKAAAAATKYAELKAQVDGAEQPTKRLVNSMEAAGRASALAAEKLGQVQQETADTRARIEGIIGPVENMGTAFRTLASTGADIARGLAVAGAAADDFKQKMATTAASVAADNAKLDKDVSFEQAGRSAGLLQAQIDYLSQFENRVELLAQAKRELVAQDAAYESALKSQEAKEGAANVQALRTQIEETIAAADRAKRVEGFQKIAADARASLADVERFSVSEDAAGASAERFSDAIQKIINPSAAAQRTIDSITASVNTASEALTGTGKKSAQDYAKAINEATSAAAGIGAIAQKIDGFKAQQAALDASSDAFDDAKRKAALLAIGLQNATEPTQEMANELKKAVAASDAAGEAFQREGQKAAEMARALKAAGVDTKDLAAAEAKLTEQARNAATVQDEAKSKLGGSGGLFGLSVQDATNLSYQFNDIFTQLASGQSIFITLAQQGPQIWQIEGVKAYIGSIRTLLPLLGLAAVAIGVLAAVTIRANEAAENSRQAAASVALMGEAGSLSADQMAQAAQRLEDFGIKAEDARASLESFSKDGLDPTYLPQMIQAAKDAADATGGDLKEAFDLLTAAMAGGQEQIDAFLDKYPVLSDAERGRVNDLIDQGKADEARTIIFNKFIERAQHAADQSKGPWKTAVDNLAQAWRNFADSSIVARFVRESIEDLDKLARFAVWVTSLLPTSKTIRGMEDDGKAVSGIRGWNGTSGAAPRPGNPGSGRRAGFEAGQAIKDAKEELDLAKGTNKALRDKARLAKAAKDAAAGAPADANDAQRAELAAIATQKMQRTIDDENRKIGERAAKRDQSARDKAARAAEALANKIASQAESLQSALDAMGSKVAKVAAGTLEEQLAGAATAVNKEYDKLFRQADAFAKLTGGKGKIGDQTIDQYRAQLDANKQILIDQAKLKVYEDNLNDTLAERKQLLAAIEDDAQRGDITGAEALTRTAEVTSRYTQIINDLTNAAILFANQIGGAKPSADLKALIAKMTSIQNDNPLGAGASGATQDAAKTNIGREESKLNQILSERNSIVESYNSLAQLGVMTQNDAARAAAAAYASSKPLVDAQIASLTALVNKARELGAISPQAFDAYIAKMQLIGVQADYIDPRLVQLKQGIENVISQNAMEGINTIAEAFGNAIAGTESWGDALMDAGRAVLMFIAKTIQMIAQLIIQAIILSAIDKATGGFISGILSFMKVFGGGGMPAKHNGGTIGSYATGQQTRGGVSISPAAIAMAPRYHDGTPSVGLRPNEQVAVLERGEKVLTEKQQRDEAASKARQGGGGRGIRQVLAFGDDQVAAAMQGPAGEDVTITHLRRNVPLLKQLVDS